MASPSCNTHCDPLHVPDSYDWTLTDFNYSQFTLPTYQSSTSTMAQPSRVSADPLQYTYPVQYPVASVAPNFAVSSDSPSTCSGMCRLNQNVMHQPPVENDCAATAPGDQATGYLGPRHDIACTNFPASASSVLKAAQVKATSNSYTKAKRHSGRTQGRQRKQDHLQRSFQCRWKDCTYLNPFSGKPALLRHIDTQHIAPRSFDCPSCDMSFNRKDNMTEHRGRVHGERVRG